MLQGEGILEDVGVGDSCLTFDRVRSRGDCEQRGRCGGSEELHAALLWYGSEYWSPKVVVCQIGNEARI